MKKALFSFIYFKLLGWKAEVSVPDYDKCIICAAPHTTNWDLIIGKLFIGAIGRESGFLMKKDWFFFPLGYLFRWMGGIPVDRSKRADSGADKEKSEIPFGNNSGRYTFGKP